MSCFPSEQPNCDAQRPDLQCLRPTKLDPCGAPCMQICGTRNPTLTCRPAGRAWGRACGPVCFDGCRWIVPTKNAKPCRPLRIRGLHTKCKMPYGFGLYARKLYPYGIPCVGSFNLPKPCCNKSFYPLLPTKPAKIYSKYTFNTRGAPYTCPRPCIAQC